VLEPKVSQPRIVGRSAPTYQRSIPLAHCYDGIRRILRQKLPEAPHTTLIAQIVRRSPLIPEALQLDGLAVYFWHKFQQLTALQTLHRSAVEFQFVTAFAAS
jgi:hypothetical protein